MTTDLISYSVQVPSGSIVPVYPPSATTTTTVPATAPTVPLTYQETTTVAFQVPSGGGDVLLGGPSRVGYTIPAGEERALDDVGKDTRVSAKSSSGTVVVEVLVIP